MRSSWDGGLPSFGEQRAEHPPGEPRWGLGRPLVPDLQLAHGRAEGDLETVYLSPPPGQMQPAPGWPLVIDSSMPLLILGPAGGGVFTQRWSSPG